MPFIDVSEAEAKMIYQGKCPCGGQLLAGPRGCSSINVKCESCGTIFNIPPKPLMPEKIVEE